MPIPDDVRVFLFEGPGEKRGAGSRGGQGRRENLFFLLCCASFELVFFCSLFSFFAASARRFRRGARERSRRGLPEQERAGKNRAERKREGERKEKKKKDKLSLLRSVGVLRVLCTF